jgi:hypothetical protein
MVILYSLHSIVGVNLSLSWLFKDVTNRTAPLRDIYLELDSGYSASESAKVNTNRYFYNNTLTPWSHNPKVISVIPCLPHVPPISFSLIWYA